MPRVEVEFDIMNKIGEEFDQFSYEEQGVLGLHLFLLVIFVAIFGTTIYFYMQYSKIYDRYDTPHFIMLIALFIHMGGIFFEFLHLWMYSHNGKGIPLFDIFSLIGYMLSEITVSCLLMMIAHGWTILY